MSCRYSPRGRCISWLSYHLHSPQSLKGGPFRHKSLSFPQKTPRFDCLFLPPFFLTLFFLFFPSSLPSSQFPPRSVFFLPPTSIYSFWCFAFLPPVFFSGGLPPALPPPVYP
ncbi:hypothetical protein F4781DRAFT_388134 [Annulohypoxylon bovei var. microspora]|nr:hypothetical protein F4781DRAFT_388134 [Annulohypoxylon bovei var. microspora]